jgi:hypothetical protein
MYELLSQYSGSGSQKRMITPVKVKKSPGKKDPVEQYRLAGLSEGSSTRATHIGLASIDRRGLADPPLVEERSQAEMMTQEEERAEEEIRQRVQQRRRVEERERAEERRRLLATQQQVEAAAAVSRALPEQDRHHNQPEPALTLDDFTVCPPLPPSYPIDWSIPDPV